MLHRALHRFPRGQLLLLLQGWIGRRICKRLHLNQLLRIVARDIGLPLRLLLLWILKGSGALLRREHYLAFDLFDFFRFELCFALLLETELFKLFFLFFAHLFGLLLIDLTLAFCLLFPFLLCLFFFQPHSLFLFLLPLDLFAL